MASMSSPLISVRYEMLLLNHRTQGFLFTAMATLGIDPVNVKVEGANEDKINFDTFLSQA